MWYYVSKNTTLYSDHYLYADISESPINKGFAHDGQVRKFFQAGLPELGTVKIISKGACPVWAKANSFSRGHAQAGHKCFDFISYLPSLGKHESQKMEVAQGGQEGKGIG
jgi:hypothetical protein